MNKKQRKSFRKRYRGFLGPTWASPSVIWKVQELVSKFGEDNAQL